MKQITIKFDANVSDADIQKLAAGAATVPGVISVVIGSEDDARKNAIAGLLFDLFQGRV